MLIDPITVAASSPTPALTFAVVQFTGTGSLRRDVPNGYSLTFNHSTSPKTGDKHYMQVQQTVVAVDPITGGNAQLTASVSISANFPAFGWTEAQKVALIKALTDTLADSDVTSTNWVRFGS
jgi:hypothetical protein